MKVLMVVVIIVTVCHLTSNFGWEGYGGGGWESGGRGLTREKQRRDENNEVNGEDRERRVGGVSERGKGEDGQVEISERQLVMQRKGVTPPQIGGEKGDETPLILLWNNYQDDKSSLYKKIFHR